MNPMSLKSLRAENTRLIALLESHDIDWQNNPAPTADYLHAVWANSTYCGTSGRRSA